MFSKSFAEHKRIIASERKPAAAARRWYRKIYRENSRIADRACEWTVASASSTL